ncbi:Uncharacterised protein [Legionella beliardensis]|uniref:Cupin domain n=1 Tax=Legionella beliardensis TaxID=91822 RepID=A0A378IAB4_9GAMM|nr:hypothetical protein [Legionella beliardensis]STX29284.1 Uncharacterised protein [Legionella beliardensis]
MSKYAFAFILAIWQFNLLYAANCETKREILIENKVTKVWKTTLCPEQKLPLHAHEFARIVIPDENGQMKVIYQTGKEETITLKKGKPVFLSVEQGRNAHQDLNISKKPLHVTVVELRQ